MNIRSLESIDYEIIAPVVDEWWGGRSVRQLLSRLFFEHFQSTSFTLMEENKLRGFLIGFISQSLPHVSYIHFVCVAPEHRGTGCGRELYRQFFTTVVALGCTEVRCITSPVNVTSIAFHQRMGFQIISKDGEQNGFSVTFNHAGEGQHRVVFRKFL